MRSFSWKRNSKLPTAVVCLIAFILLPSLSKVSAQTSPTPLPTLKLSTQIVVLDVVVTDKKGTLIQRKLQRSDFSILEDKVPQVIRSFEAPEEHRMPASSAIVVHSAADLRKIGEAPVVILALDELNSRFEDMSYARQMMVKYLQSQPAVLPQPTLLAVAENRSFHQLHDYTQDRDELIQLVRKHLPQYPAMMMGSRNSGAGAVERMAQVLATLQQLAQSSLGTRGRKNLIWVGNGFPSADISGLTDTDANQVEAAIQRCTSMLLASRVTMYTIDPAPGTSATVEIDTVDDLTGAVGDNGQNPFGTGTVAFSSFATATGGIAFTGRNDLNNVIGEGIAKGDDYYTLSYSPSDKQADPTHFRNIRIVMADPNLRASTRQGYFTPAAGVQALPPGATPANVEQQARANLQLDLSAALKTTLSYNGLGVTSEKGADGPYLIHVKEAGLTWTAPAADGSQHAEATVLAAWYDAKGKLTGHVAREETFVRKSEPGALFTLPLSFPATTKRLRFVVRDAFNGNLGSFYQNQ